MFQNVIRGILFDFDGTLTLPGAVDYRRVRAELACPAEIPILEYLATLPVPQKKAALQKLDEMEFLGAEHSRPNPSARDLIRFLKERKIPFSILTRNRRRSVLKALEHFDFLEEEDFYVIITRDDPFPPKPDPSPVLHIADQMGLRPDQLLVVGDYIYDIESGKLAGCPTVHLKNQREYPLYDPDLEIDSLDELIPILDLHTALPMGKLPNRILRSILEQIEIFSDDVVVGPGIGEDVAVVRTNLTTSHLVLKSDPITFTTRDLPNYSLTINANDLACAGADPKWFTATILAPVGTAGIEIEQLILGLSRQAKSMGIQLCGGHTEITNAVNGMIISGHLTGVASAENLVLKCRANEGDELLLTKSLAIEGTCILAHEFSNRLLDQDVPSEILQSGKNLIDSVGISILEEARIASRFPGVTSLHDVTEGGIAAAVEEISESTGHRIGIYPEKIPFLEETAQICSALGLDPYGLIGSGSLLITVKSKESENLIDILEHNGIQTTRIGCLKEKGTGVECIDSPLPSWPHFERDEIARAFQD
jgi:HAD superfamily hydrolase (TIGR01509 family)